jgi:REP element-mobilizing transposase RayT
MPRQARLDVSGTLHHVIVRGIEKRRIVDDQKDCEAFVTRLGDIVTDTKTGIYAWSLMNNHAHLLVRSGPLGLSQFMRRLLTGYAIKYNRRHVRIGHVFHNRYRSIVCDEDPYFRELVRYIHLNPLRAGLVKDIGELNQFPRSGHAVILGRIKHEWQDRSYALSWFGKKEGVAKKAYLSYIQEGVAQGRRPELVGGGLVRSLGGWSEVVSLRSSKQQLLTDERILGCGDFVEKILKDADERFRCQIRAKNQRGSMQKLIEDMCRKKKINIMELRMGSRRKMVSRVRADLANMLMAQLGIPSAEIARQLGVSTSAIVKILREGEEQ